MNLIKEGGVFRVKRLNHNHKASKRLIDMGVTPNTVISVDQIAPFGDPYIIKVRNYFLAIRKKDLSAIEFEEV
jgi:Fe2+ transport system protein FeoA